MKLRKEKLGEIVNKKKNAGKRRVSGVEQRCKKRLAWLARLCYFSTICANFWPVYAQNWLNSNAVMSYFSTGVQLC